MHTSIVPWPGLPLKGLAPHGSATTGDASQRTCIAAAPQVEQPKKKEEGSQGPKQNWRCHYQEPRWPLYQVVTNESAMDV